MDDERELLAALEQYFAQPESGRGAFLESLGRNEPELEERLRAFVEAPISGEFLERLPLEPFDEEDTERWLGQCLGPYRLVEHLGAGGMGTVFLARQERPVERLVALKLIREPLPNESAIRRFEAERQTLATLSHPAIARLYDAGATEDGHPYLVMEHVPGEDLLTACDRQSAGLEERLRLFLEVCSAVQHAHQRGILHRDLKPSNILVGPREPGGVSIARIIDFGVARALDQKAESPHEGGPVGTLAYLSPEAVSGDLDLDTRADVYALGVVLFELLVGVRPFANDESLAGLTLRSGEEEPPTPLECWRSLDDERRRALAAARRTDERRWRARLGGEIAWVVRKALAPDRDDRYEGVAQLADDIRRYLEGDLLAAAPESLWYPLRTWARRHLWTTVAVTVVLASLIGAVVASSLALASTRRAEANARAEAATAERVVSFLVELFEASDPEQKAALERQGDLSALDLLARGAQELEVALHEEPSVRARLQLTLGQIYRKLGRYEEAENLLRSALETVGASEARQVPDDLPQRARILDALATVLILQGDLDEAAPFSRRALAAREATFPEASVEVITSLNNLAILESRTGDRTAAAELYRRAGRLIPEVFGPDHPHLATNRHNRAMLAAAEGDWKVAEELYDQAIDLWRRTLGPRHPNLATGLNNLGRLYLVLGRSDDAERVLTEALSIQEETLGRDHPALGLTRINLAQAARRQGRLDEADRFVLETLEDWNGRLVDRVWALAEQAAIERDRGNVERARELYAEALDLASSEGLPEDADLERVREEAHRLEAGED